MCKYEENSKVNVLWPLRKKETRRSETHATKGIVDGKPSVTFAWLYCPQGLHFEQHSSGPLHVLHLKWSRSKSLAQ